MVANAEEPKPKVTLSRLTLDQNEMHYRKVSKRSGTGTINLRKKEIPRPEFKGWLQVVEE
jgi:hypothetical protein